MKKDPIDRLSEKFNEAGFKLDKGPTPANPIGDANYVFDLHQFFVSALIVLLSVFVGAFSFGTKCGRVQTIRDLKGGDYLAISSSDHAYMPNELYPQQEHKLRLWQLEMHELQLRYEVLRRGNEMENE